MNKYKIITINYGATNHVDAGNIYELDCGCIGATNLNKILCLNDMTEIFKKDAKELNKIFGNSNYIYIITDANQIKIGEIV